MCPQLDTHLPDPQAQRIPGQMMLPVPTLPQIQTEPVDLLTLLCVNFKENGVMPGPLAHDALSGTTASAAPASAGFRGKLTMEECFST